MSMTDPRLRLISGVAAANDDDLAEIVALLDDPTIRIVVPGAAPRWHHQLLLLTLVDLCGRLFPRLDIDVDGAAPAHGVLPPGPATVGERITAVRARSPLDPLPPGEATLTILIGADPDTGADLYVDAHGWQSYLGTVPSRLPHDAPTVAVGPIAAAARAGAHVMRHLVMRHTIPLPDEMYESALTYRSDTNPIDDPATPEPTSIDAVLAGAGSVGGAAVYTFEHQPHLEGRLGAVDDQTVADENPYRALLATRTAAAQRDPKVDVVTGRLAHHHNLEVTGDQVRFAAFDAQRAEPGPWPLVLVAVDTVEARREIQDALPLDVVNAACDPDFVMISGHRTGDGPCLYCLHIGDVLDSRQIKNKLIAEATGLAEAEVNARRAAADDHLDAKTIRTIEQHRRLALGSLAQHEGTTLDELWDAALVYGQVQVQASGGAQIAVASPFITAFAGVLLAAECFKRGKAELERFALGPGRATRVTTNPYATLMEEFVEHLDRWPTSECLCRSARRLRLIADRYGLGHRYGHDTVTVP